jgi:hypothetical protein
MNSKLYINTFSQICNYKIVFEIQQIEKWEKVLMDTE